MRRKATEPHLKYGGIYRMRWWAKVDSRNGLHLSWMGESKVLSYGAFAQRMSRRGVFLLCMGRHAALLLTCKKDKSSLISGINVWMWIISSGQKEQ